LPTTPVCENGACWVNPLPSGTWWLSTQASSASNVWVAGYGPNSLHFDGQSWQVVQNGLFSTISYWAFSPTDVWASDGANIVHGDGTTFTASAIPTGVSAGGRLWGAAPDDLYSAGSPLAHWDGHVWSAVPQAGDATFVTGSGSYDVWAANTTQLSHFDGNSWTSVAPPNPSPYILDIASAGSGQVWMLTLFQGGYHIYKFAGTGWSESLVISQKVNLFSLISAGTNQVVAVGQRYETVPPRPHAFAVRWNGTSWTELSLPQPGGLQGGWIDASGAGYLVGDNGTLLHLGATGVDRSVTQGQDVNFTGVWGRGPDDVWLVDDQGGSHHYDGCTITLVATGSTAPLADVWGAGQQDVWAVGAGGVVLHYDGVTWSPISSGTTADLRAVWAASPADAWVGGAHNTLLRLTPSGVTSVAIPGAAGAPAETMVTDISGTGPSDVWIATAGPPGTILHFDGTGFSAPTQLPPGRAGAPISRIWAYAPNDVWAFPETGPTPNPFHFDGTSWSPITIPIPPGARVILPPPTYIKPTIRNTFAFDPNHILWVGTAGVFLRTQ
jgi:hypothetical protein